MSGTVDTVHDSYSSEPIDSASVPGPSHGDPSDRLVVDVRARVEPVAAAYSALGEVISDDPSNPDSPTPEELPDLATNGTGVSEHQQIAHAAAEFEAERKRDTQLTAN